MSKKDFNQDFFNNKNTKKNVSVYDEIKQTSYKKKFAKIVKFLEKKGINVNDICFQKQIYGNQNTVFTPLFSCYYQNYVKDQQNIFLVVLFQDTRNSVNDHKAICEQYFSNFENLYFILFFDASLRPILYYYKQEDNNGYLLKVEEKNIAKFY
ncbi:MAG: hypothetical protein HUJ42_03665 [Malacoplasma sp.]|nr:hypothetical protein [Malacoplasma sp.]